MDILPGNIDRAMCEVVFKGPEVLATETICLLKPFLPFAQDGLRSFTVERNHPLEHWSDHALDRGCFGVPHGLFVKDIDEVLIEQSVGLERVSIDSWHLCIV